MKHIDVNVEGTSVKFECEELSGLGEVEASRGEHVVKLTHDAFGEAIEMAKTSAEQFLKLTDNLSCMPSEVKIEFGLKIDAEAGAIVAKASTGAHFKVTLAWNPKRSSNAPKV